MVTTEEEVNKLLEPRIMVRHDYPDSPFDKNEILSMHVGESSIWFHAHGDYLPKVGVDKYIADGANIFRYLNWWESRKIEEMPKYLRHTYSQKVHEVVSYAEYSVGSFVAKMKEHEFPILSNFQPITEAEYLL